MTNRPATKENDKQVALVLRGVSDVGRGIAKPKGAAAKARKASAREAMTAQEALVNALNDRGKDDAFGTGLLRIACFTTKHRGHAWTVVSPRTRGRYLDNDKMRARLEAAGFEKDPETSWHLLFASDVQAPEGKSEEFKATVAALGLPSDPWSAPFEAIDAPGWFLNPDCNADVYLPPLDRTEVADTSSPLSHLTPLSPPTPISSQERAEPPAKPPAMEPLPPPLLEQQEQPEQPAWLAGLHNRLYGPGAPKRPYSRQEYDEMEEAMEDAQRGLRMEAGFPIFDPGCESYDPKKYAQQPH